MMLKRAYPPLLMVLPLALAGCGDDSQQSSEPQQDASGMEAVKEQAQAAMESAGQAGKQALQAAQEAAGLSQEQGAALAENAKVQIQAWLEQAQNALAENNLASAQDVLDKISALKASLPESIQTQVDALQEQLASLRQQDEPEAMPAQAAPSSTD